MSFFRPDDFVDPKTLSPRKRKEMRSALLGMMCVSLTAIIIAISSLIPGIIKNLPLLNKSPGWPCW